MLWSLRTFFGVQLAVFEPKRVELCQIKTLLLVSLQAASTISYAQTWEPELPRRAAHSLEARHLPLNEQEI